jgi:hypothetical protein
MMAQEFVFEFEATADSRKGIPYVAHLTIENGKIARAFHPMERRWGRKEITVFGTYKAKVGDIVEERHGGSWKNDYRYWYLVLPDGEQKKVADIDNSRQKLQVERYLKGEISMEDLLS